MIKNVKLADNGRIEISADPPYSAGDGEIQVDFPVDFDFARQNDWRIENGALIHDPLPEPELPPDPIEQLRAEYDLALMELAEMILGGAL